MCLLPDVDQRVCGQRLAHGGLVPLLWGEADGAAEAVHEVVHLELLGAVLLGVLCDELRRLLVAGHLRIRVDADALQHRPGIHAAVERVPCLGVFGRVESSGAVLQRSVGPALLPVGHALIQLLLRSQAEHILTVEESGGNAAEPHRGVCGVNSNLALVVLAAPQSEDLVCDHSAHGVQRGGDGCGLDGSRDYGILLTLELDSREDGLILCESWGL